MNTMSFSLASDAFGQFQRQSANTYFSLKLICQMPATRLSELFTLQIFAFFEEILEVFVLSLSTQGVK